MDNTEFSCTSLCCVYEDERGLRLQRLADLKDGKFIKFFPDGAQKNIYGNRENMPLKGESFDVGYVGVWEWTASQNEEYPENDKITTVYLPNIRPMRAAKVNVVSSKILFEAFKNGKVAYSAEPTCDVLFYYESQKSQGQLRGFLCPADKFEVVDGYVKLNDDIDILYGYIIKDRNFLKYTYKDSNGRVTNVEFLRNVTLGKPDTSHPIDKRKTVCRAIRECAKWSVFKEAKLSDAKWKDFRSCVKIIGSDTIIEGIQKRLKCDQKTAEEALEKVLVNADEILEYGDIDVEILAELVENREGLKAQCKELWEKQNAEIVAKGKQKISENEARLVEQKNEIDANQKKLAQLLEEIEQNKKLGEDALQGVRSKISEAREDMASFLAEISVFVPQPYATQSSQNNAKSWKYESSPEGVYPDNEVAQTNCWQDEYNVLLANLSDSLAIGEDFGRMLAAYLYSAHIHNVPLLFAGPGGKEIADALSASLYCREAGRLTLGDEIDYDIVDEMSKRSDPVISIGNMFGKGWFDVLPEEFSRLNKQIVWTHPTVEDMAIEPKGLFNYMTPILSEPFIGTLPALKFFPGRRLQNEFKEFDKNVDLKDVKLELSNAFEFLGLSKLLVNKLKLVFRDAKHILNKSEDKDIEVLLGLLPLCAVTGRIDTLKKLNDKFIAKGEGISKEVRDEVARYIDKE